MKLLLDTHIWLWSRLQPRNLSRRVAGALEAAENELWLSPISVWELGVLAEKGRVMLNSDVNSWVAEAMRKVPLKDAPVTYEVALESFRIRLPHRDPADRLLAATARVFDLTLVTADERLAGVKGISVLPNR